MATENDRWKTANEWESEWWGQCINTLNEEMKQLVYAQKMRLKIFKNNKGQTVIDTFEKHIIDIGGGPCSMLLKCIKPSGLVLDPCRFPQWVYERYRLNGITPVIHMAEEYGYWYQGVYDECWIYNVLQHVNDVEKVIKNALSCSKVIRIFEWIDTQENIGHPNILTEQILNNLLHGYGKVESLNQSECIGRCYYGMFKGNHYNE